MCHYGMIVWGDGIQSELGDAVVDCDEVSLVRYRPGLTGLLNSHIELLRRWSERLCRHLRLRKGWARALGEPERTWLTYEYWPAMVEIPLGSLVHLRAEDTRYHPKQTKPGACGKRCGGFNTYFS